MSGLTRHILGRYSRTHAVCLLLVAAGLAPTLAHSQFIDFETLPGGGATVDQQTITDQYAVYGVTFTLLDRVTGEPMGAPRIAKAGPPRTAFEGCFEVDTPRPHLDLGESFLTDGTAVAVEGDLLIEYVVPVALASGIILDIDCRVAGGPPCEQWTITAYDDLGAVLQTVILDGPPGPINPECSEPETGPGDAEAFGWYVSDPSARIKSIKLRYTGTATTVGLAFDNFSVAGLPDPPAVTATSTATTVCPGERVELKPLVANGLPPFTFLWQKNVGAGAWVDIGWNTTEIIQPTATASYRVVVTDATGYESTSAPLDVVVTPGDPLCDAVLLVSSYNNDRVVRYGFQSGLADVLVPTGSGGLNGPSKLICGGDGNIYVSSQANDRVLRFDAATGAFVDIFVAAGSGGLSIPIGLDIGPDGNLYVASYNTHAILRYSAVDGSFIDAFVPNGSGLNGPTGLLFGPSGDLYVSSREGDKVLRFDGTTGAPLGDFVTAGSGGLDAPRGLAFGPDGHLYVAEEFNDSVRRFDGATGAFIDIFIPQSSGGLDRANDVAFGPDGLCYVISTDSDEVLVYDGNSGAYLGGLPDELLDHPGWVAVGCAPGVSPVPEALAQVGDLQVEPGVPNPFNPHTTVEFTLARAAFTRVAVIDLRGRVVATLLQRPLTAGRHAVAWNGRTDAGQAAPSGVYFMSVQSGSVRRSAKMMLVR